MSIPIINISIVDDNSQVDVALHTYLTNKFGSGINVSRFYSGTTAIKALCADTHIVILDADIPNEDANETLRTIKRLCPQTEVIIQTSNEEAATAIESFRSGVKDYVIKGNKSPKKISLVVYNIIVTPLRLMVNEFGINKYLAMFLLTFAAKGIGIFIALNFAV